MKPQNINRLWSLFLIKRLCQHSIRHFYLSPGMRNAPLIWGVENEEDAIAIDSLDERSAGYRALSFSKSSKIPSVLICTSGTAVLNYLPALQEAKETKTPLLVISADRPFEKIHSKANQTTAQESFLSEVSTTKFLWDSPNEDVSLKEIDGIISNIIFKLKSNEIVHLNMPFRDPLDQTQHEYSDVIFNQFNSLLLNKKEILPSQSTKSLDLDALKKFLNTFNRPIISIGKSIHKKQLKVLLTMNNIPKILDINSGLKREVSLKYNTWPSPDHPEVRKYLSEYKPDLLLHFGKRVTSKYYYEYFKSDETCEKYINLEESSFHNPEGIFDHFVNNFDKLKHRSKKTWKIEENPFLSLEQKKADIIENGPLSTPYISKTVYDCILSDHSLFIGNSSIIRSFDNYTSPLSQIDPKIITHRGVSGIEGHLSSVMGLADSTKQNICAIIGDISCLHDIGALNFFSNSTKGILLIILNNKGGGIFDLLPISKDKKTLKHMKTTHNVDFSQLAKAFGIDFGIINNHNKNLLRNEIKNISYLTRPRILEIDINEEENNSIYNQLKTVTL